MVRDDTFPFNVFLSHNSKLLCTVNPEDIAVHIERAGEAEMDEMWSARRSASRKRRRCMTSSWVCQQLCFWTCGVHMAISTFRTLPGFLLTPTYHIAQHKAHASIVFTRQQQHSVGGCMRCLLRLRAHLTAEAMQNRVEFLSAGEEMG
jgi:hypothetical protein